MTVASGEKLQCRVEAMDLYHQPFNHIRVVYRHHHQLCLRDARALQNLLLHGITVEHGISFFPTLLNEFRPHLNSDIRDPGIAQQAGDTLSHSPKTRNNYLGALLQLHDSQRRIHLLHLTINLGFLALR